jgi:hypothetical protein
LDMLLTVYAKKLPKRFTLQSFEIIMNLHTTLRHLNKHDRSTKWLDLAASFKIHAVMKKGLPDSIGKRQCKVVLDVNEVELDINFDRLTRDMRAGDKLTNKLHLLIMDDPLVQSDRKVRREHLLRMQAPDKNKAVEEQIMRMKRFKQELNSEEDYYGIKVHPDRRARLRKKFEEKEALTKRAQLRMEAKQKAREDARIADELARKEALEKLEEIKRDRLAYEARLRECKIMSIEDAAATMFRAIFPYPDPEPDPEPEPEVPAVDPVEEAARAEREAEEERERERQAELARREAVRKERQERREREDREAVDRMIRELMSEEERAKHKERQKAKKDEQKALAHAARDAAHVKAADGSPETRTYPTPLPESADRDFMAAFTVSVPAEVTGDKREQAFLEALEEKERKDRAAARAEKAKAKKTSKPTPGPATELARRAPILTEKEKLMQKAHDLAKKEEEEAAAKAKGSPNKEEMTNYQRRALIKKEKEKEHQAQLAMEAMAMKEADRIRQEKAAKKLAEKRAIAEQERLLAEAIAAEAALLAAADNSQPDAESSPLASSQTIPATAASKSGSPKKTVAAPAPGAARGKKKNDESSDSDAAASMRRKRPDRKATPGSKSVTTQQKVPARKASPGVEQSSLPPIAAPAAVGLEPAVKVKEEPAAAESRPVSAVPVLPPISARVEEPAPAVAPSPSKPVSAEPQQRILSAKSTKSESTRPESGKAAPRKPTPEKPRTSAAAESHANVPSAKSTKSESGKAAPLSASSEKPSVKSGPSTAETRTPPRAPSAKSTKSDGGRPESGKAAPRQSTADAPVKSSTPAASKPSTPSNEDYLQQKKKGIADESAEAQAEELEQYELASPSKRMHNFHDNEVNEDAIPDLDESGYQFFMGQSSLDGSFDDDGSYHFDDGGSDYNFEGNLDPESDELLEKYFFNSAEGEDDEFENFIADYEDQEALQDNAPAFVVHDINRPLMLPTFQDLAYLPTETFEFLIPKSDDGELRLIIRYDDAGGGEGVEDDEDSDRGHHRRGLFLHGFKANCKAENLDLLKIGDEILAVNGVSIAGQHLFFLVSLLEEFVADDSVMLKIRRRYDVDQEGKNLRTNLTQMYGTSRKLTRDQLIELEENDDLLMEDMEELSQAEADEADEDHIDVEPPDPMFSTTQSMGGAGIVPNTLFEDTLKSRKASPKKRAPVPLDTEAADEYEYIVPKSIDGTLRLIILKAEASPRPTIAGSAPMTVDDERIPGGLYIHGFKANSKAEESGLLKVGDELTAVNGVDIRGKELHDIADVLEEYLLDDFIVVKIRRRRVMISSLRPDSSFHQSVKQQWQETQVKSQIVVHDWNEFDDDEENEEQVRHLLDFGRPLPPSKPGTAAGSRIGTAAAGASRSQSDGGAYITPTKRATSSRGASARRLSSTPILRLQTPNSIKAMRKLPTDILQFTIPKTNGELCLYIRHEDEGIDGGHGLFIHGFKQVAVFDDLDGGDSEFEEDIAYERSLVEQQGLIKIGDELITINGIDVEGKYLEDVVAALRNHSGDEIPVCIKRRPIAQ